ncbi:MULTISPECIES: hypothetical protein [Hyphomonas]|uniref:hypothetical protein n=1 Tax=Hyphomonas TaxID=85 RepID=UPI0012DF0F46|nr:MULTISPECIES: hypothetical protein [Hyphomonas]
MNKSEKNTFNALVAYDRTGNRSACLHIIAIHLHGPMRQVWVLVFCIMFSVSGALLPVEHAAAHTRAADSLEQANHDDHGSDHVFMPVDAQAGASPAHQDHMTGDSEDHAADLHFVGVTLPSPATARQFPASQLGSRLAILDYPAPLLPPDPDPDRI